MTKDDKVVNIFAVLDQTVQDVLTYFEGPGSKSSVRIDKWGVREMLSHLIFWHEATIEGINSVTHGGSPYRVDEPTNVLNDRAAIKYQEMGIENLIARLRELQKQLLKALSNMPDLDAPVMFRRDGTPLSGRQRLETIKSHWTKHMEEFQAAESKRK